MRREKLKIVCAELATAPLMPFHSKGFLRSAWILSLLLGALAFPLQAAAKDLAVGPSRFQAGEPVIVQFRERIGLAIPAEQYVLQCNRTAGNVILAPGRQRSLATYPTSAGNGECAISIAGIALTWGSQLNCFHRTNDPAQRCVLDILGPLLPDPADHDLIDIGFQRVIVQLRQHLADPSAVVRRDRSCPSNPNIPMSHVAIRFAAEALRINGSILPFILDQKKRTEAENEVDRALDWLLANAPATARTSYTECYGGLDLITAFHAVRALDIHDQMKSRPDFVPYLRRLWMALRQEGAIKLFGEANAGDHTKLPNGFSAYLHIATVMERHGIHAYEDFTWRGLDLLLKAQVKPDSSECNDANGSFRLDPGGWPRSDSDCAELLGYHEFIVSSLIATKTQLVDSGRCQRSHARLCHQIDASLDAALGWVKRLQESSGGLLDRSKRSTITAAAPNSGDVAGALVGFAVLAVRPGYDDRTWRLLRDALARAILARVNHLPIAAYLQSNMARSARR